MLVSIPGPLGDPSLIQLAPHQVKVSVVLDSAYCAAIRQDIEDPGFRGFHDLTRAEPMNLPGCHSFAP